MILEQAEKLHKNITHSTVFTSRAYFVFLTNLNELYYDVLFETPMKQMVQDVVLIHTIQFEYSNDIIYNSMINILHELFKIYIKDITL